MSADVVTFAGKNRRGRDAGGNTTESPADVAERLYNAGWRSLRVMRRGFQVGGIAPDPDTQHRSWWGEKA